MNNIPPRFGAVLHTNGSDEIFLKNLSKTGLPVVQLHFKEKPKHIFNHPEKPDEVFVASGRTDAATLKAYGETLKEHLASKEAAYREGNPPLEGVHTRAIASLMQSLQSWTAQTTGVQIDRKTIVSMKISEHLPDGSNTLILDTPLTTS